MAAVGESGGIYKINPAEKAKKFSRPKKIISSVEERR